MIVTERLGGHLIQGGLGFKWTGIDIHVNMGFVCVITRWTLLGLYA